MASSSKDGFGFTVGVVVVMLALAGVGAVVGWLAGTIGAPAWLAGAAASVTAALLLWMLGDALGDG
jgi:VIT1/CCC1 family predicted Fe2+/Mn2+ transporter